MRKWGGGQDSGVSFFATTSCESLLPRPVGSKDSKKGFVLSGRENGGGRDSQSSSALPKNSFLPTPYPSLCLLCTRIQCLTLPIPSPEDTACFAFCLPLPNTTRRTEQVRCHLFLVFQTVKCVCLCANSAGDKMSGNGRLGWKNEGRDIFRGALASPRLAS